MHAPPRTPDSRTLWRMAHDSPRRVKSSNPHASPAPETRSLCHHEPITVNPMAYDNPQRAKRSNPHAPPAPETRSLCYREPRIVNPGVHKALFAA